LHELPKLKGIEDLNNLKSLIEKMAKYIIKLIILFTIVFLI